MPWLHSTITIQKMKHIENARGNDLTHRSETSGRSGATSVVMEMLIGGSRAVSVIRESRQFFPMMNQITSGTSTKLVGPPLRKTPELTSEILPTVDVTTRMEASAEKRDNITVSQATAAANEKIPYLPSKTDTESAPIGAKRKSPKHKAWTILHRRVSLRATPPESVENHGHEHPSFIRIAWRKSRQSQSIV